MEAQLKGAVLIALVVVPQWRCPILKPLSAKLPPKSETAPHPGWQDGTILQHSSSAFPVPSNFLCQAPLEVHFRVAKSFLLSKVAPFALSH